MTEIFTIRSDQHKSISNRIYRRELGIIFLNLSPALLVLTYETTIYIKLSIIFCVVLFGFILNKLKVKATIRTAIDDFSIELDQNILIEYRHYLGKTIKNKLTYSAQGNTELGNTINTSVVDKSMKKKNSAVYRVFDLTQCSFTINNAGEIVISNPKHYLKLKLPPELENFDQVLNTVKMYTSGNYNSKIELKKC